MPLPHPSPPTMLDSQDDYITSMHPLVIQLASVVCILYKLRADLHVRYQRPLRVGRVSTAEKLRSSVPVVGRPPSKGCPSCTLRTGCARGLLVGLAAHISSGVKNAAQKQKSSLKPRQTRFVAAHN